MVSWASLRSYYAFQRIRAFISSPERGAYSKLVAAAPNAPAKKPSTNDRVLAFLLFLSATCSTAFQIAQMVRAPPYIEISRAQYALARRS